MIRRFGYYSVLFVVLGLVIHAQTPNPIELGLLEIGPDDFRISEMGPNGNVGFNAISSNVTYNSTNNEYFVVWSGDDTVDGENEVFAQRIEATTGAELGTNDLRISHMGPDEDPSYDGMNPAVAYNPTNNEYLVVWEGDDDSGGLVDEEFEIFGQRIGGATGQEIGTDDFLISDREPVGNASFDSWSPAVTYNPTNNEYLVVWSGESNVGGMVDEEFEVFGQRINAATGVAVSVNFRISDMGPVGDSNFWAGLAAIAYNPTNNEYLVVWSADHNTGGLVDEEYEVFGQRLNGATAQEIGTNDFRISDMGPDGDVNFEVWTPAVAYNFTNNEYLVVLDGNNDLEGLNREYEIYGQRISGATGAEVGTNDFRISDMGPVGNANFSARFPYVTYNSVNNEYLVVWRGEDDIGTLVDDELEIFVQRIDAVTGAEVGINDFRISNMGPPDGNLSYDTGLPRIDHNPTNNEYLAVWRGDKNSNGLVDNELEIFGQLLRGDGIQVVEGPSLSPDQPKNLPTTTPPPAKPTAEPKSGSNPVGGCQLIF